MNVVCRLGGHTMWRYDRATRVRQDERGPFVWESHVGENIVAWVRVCGRCHRAIAFWTITDTGYPAGSPEDMLLRVPATETYSRGG